MRDDTQHPTEIGGRFGRVALGAVVLAAAVTILAAPSAQARNVHPFIPGSAFSLPATGNPISLAVNETTHELLAVSGNDGTNHSAVYRVTSTGLVTQTLTGLPPELEAFRVAIDNSATASNGLAYVSATAAFGGTANGIIRQFNSTTGAATSVTIDLSDVPSAGTPQAGGMPGVVNNGQFKPAAVAVDASGNLFTEDRSNGAVDKFSSTGNFIAQYVIEPGLFGPFGVTASGEMYFGDRGVLMKRNAQGECVNSCTPIYESSKGLIGGIAVGTSGEVLVTFSGLHQSFREFSSTGELLGESGKEELTQATAIAWDQSNGRVYVTDEVPRTVNVFGPAVAFPDAITEEASEVTGSTATLNGQVGAGGGVPATCLFQYVADEEFLAEGFAHAQTAPCAPAGPFTGSGLAPVHASVTGLSGGTNYHYRLVASSAEGLTRGEDQPFLTLGPSLLTQRVTDISETGGRFEATIDPHGNPTTYRFQYVDQATFEASGFTNALEAPVGGAEIGAAEIGTKEAEIEVGEAKVEAGEAKVEAGEIEAGNAEVQAGKAEIKAGKAPFEVAQDVTSLTPGTTYHFRVVATNAEGEAFKPDRTFATFAQRAAALPDGRTYEQATPVAKNGGDASGWESLLKAAPDGSAVSYFITGGGSAEGGGGQEFPTYAAHRGAEGWQSHALLPSSTLGERVKVSGWSEDLKRDYVLTWYSGTTATFYVQHAADGSVEEVANGLKPFVGAIYAGESADGQEVLFESTSALAPGAHDGAWNLFIYNRTNGSLSLVGLLPGEETGPTAGTFAGPYAWPKVSTAPSGVTKTGGANAGFYTQDMHVISNDGTKAFFTTSGVNQLYVREGIGTGAEETVQVSASQKTNGTGTGGKDPKGPKKAAFMEATPDGRYVFFTSQEELTNDATTGAADQGNDLYRYDTESGQLIDLAPDTIDTKGTEVQGLIGAGADGSYAYFVANGVLAEGATKGNCESSPPAGWGGSGRCNIYLWHDGTISFVAKVGATEMEGGLSWLSAPHFSTSSGAKTARVSPSGKVLVFVTSLSETSYDSEGEEELYRYSTTEGLACVSCNPTGTPPVASVHLQDIDPGLTKPQPANYFLARNLAADGNRVFFESADKLVAGDTNGDAGCPRTKGQALSCQDVYEWEAEGTGSCESDIQNGGCLYLISTGESPEPSYFADASESGSDAFFLTRQSLVRQDTDQLQDVYDARVDGGIASQNAAPPTPCEGEACKGGTTPAPGSQSAGSASFSGPPNPTPVHHKAKKKKRHAKKHHKKAKKTAKARSHR